MGEISKKVTSEVRNNLAIEEDFRNHVYDDGWGNLKYGGSNVGNISYETGAFNFNISSLPNAEFEISLAHGSPFAGKMDTAKALAAVLDKVMDWDGEQMGKDGDPKVAMTVLDKLMDMNDMKNKGKMTVTQQIEASTVETTLADIQEKKKLFKATQTEVTDGLQQTEGKTTEQVTEEKEK